VKRGALSICVKPHNLIVPWHEPNNDTQHILYAIILHRAPLAQMNFRLPSSCIAIVLGPPHGLGICILLLVMQMPLRTKRPTTGWNSKIVPCAQIPNGKLSSVQPLLTQYAINAAIDSDVGMGVPSKYLLLPVASLGTLATVILKRARRVRPQRTKKVRKRWSTGVRSPIAKAAAAGETPKDTKSANESSSCPIRLLFFRHLATFPSMKSKNRPKGMNAKAAQRLPCAEGGPRQYRMEAKIDMTPQKPFSSVMRSARCSILIMEKCPESSWRSFFCLSSAISFEAPLEAVVLVRFDMLTRTLWRRERKITG